SWYCSPSSSWARTSRPRRPMPGPRPPTRTPMPSSTRPLRSRSTSRPRTGPSRGSWPGSPPTGPHRRRPPPAGRGGRGWAARFGRCWQRPNLRRVLNPGARVCLPCSGRLTVVQSVRRPAGTYSDPGHVVEAGVVPDEGQPLHTGGTVAVLGHDDLRGALALGRFGVVDLVPVDEHHHVGVLLDGAGLSQVGQHRALVLALLQPAGQLGQCHHRHLEPAGEDLEAGADLGPPALAVPRAVPSGHQLEVVDPREAQPLAAL